MTDLDPLPNSCAVPSYNTPLERPGVRPHADVSAFGAGRSAASR
jgi:hypothetical protein